MRGNEAVIHIGQLRCKVTLTPRMISTVKSEEGGRNGWSWNKANKEYALYQMRKRYVRSAAGLDNPAKLPHHPKPTQLKGKSQVQTQAIPRLSIGNWEKPGEWQSPRFVEESKSGNIHHLPAYMRVAERSLAAIPVKLIELNTDKPRGSSAALLKSPVYQQCLALFSAPHSPSGILSPAEPLTPPSPPTIDMETQRASARKCEGNCGNKTRDMCVRTRTVSEPKHPPQLTAVVPHMRAINPPATVAFPGRLPLHKPLKTHAKELVDFRKALPDASPAISPFATFSRQSTSTKFRNIQVELVPKTLPPHRIPVEYGFFRRVHKH